MESKYIVVCDSLNEGLAFAKQQELPACNTWIDLDDKRAVAMQVDARSASTVIVHDIRKQPSTN